MCVSHTKRIGDKKTVFTTQEVRMSASHWFILLKNNQKRQQGKALMQILQEQVGETKIRSMKFLPRFKSSKFVDTVVIFADVSSCQYSFWTSSCLDLS